MDWCETGSACWGHGGKRRAASGERGRGCPASGCLNRSGRGRHKMQAQPNPRFCGGPKTGTALSAGPSPCRAAGSLSSADGESTDTRERGKPSVARTRRVLPTHSDVCLQPPPSPQQDWTELVNLNKRSPPPACVRTEIRHRRDGKQKPNKQRESLQNGRHNRLKFLKVTPTTPEGAYRYREV